MIYIKSWSDPIDEGECDKSRDHDRGKDGGGMGRGEGNQAVPHLLPPGPGVSRVPVLLYLIVETWSSAIPNQVFNFRRNWGVRLRFSLIVRLVRCAIKGRVIMLTGGESEEPWCAS